jgi:endonuclease/exonuclease/phosphatase family metal-dependent hydrolase
MKVMTFKVRYGSAKDSANNWKFRKNLLITLLKSHAPDFIGMQEMEHFQLVEILNELNDEYATVGLGRDGATNGEMNPILFRKEKFVCTETNTHWLSNTPNTPGSTSYGNRLPRIFTWGHFLTLDNEKKTFLFVNTHLDHQSSEARVKGCKQILRFISEQSEKTHVILTGDFNNRTLNDEEVKLVLEDGLMMDSYRVANKVENEFTFHGFTGQNKFEWGVSTIIDFIFVSSGGFNVIDSNIIKDNENGRYPSDHFPVCTVLE